MDLSNLKPVSRNLWEIPRTGSMRVPGRIYLNKKLLVSILKDNAIDQVKNVAHLPGIQKFSLAMPDIHRGYGFPIGGVAAMDAEHGVISPGGVGYDINCGVRFIKTNLNYSDIKQKLPQLADALFKAIPTGVGSKNAISALTHRELKELLCEGAKWAVNKGFGRETDLEAIEENGCLAEADPEKVSSKALKRGSNQVGTLGSGNHFIELGRISDIFNEGIADQFRLKKDQVIVMIHTGSRGIGHQICDDYVYKMVSNFAQLGFDLPDKQLACAYIRSELGEDYYGAMAAAANFAWANRQIIMNLVERCLMEELRISNSALGFELIYDVSHNIAKFEDHIIDGTLKRVCVHRKGATRAFGPENASLASKYKKTGQPVIIPGDMGTESYLCMGTDKAMLETFGSSCHGAGRVMSRNKARKSSNIRQVQHDLDFKGIIVKAASNHTILEEMSSAYKDVSEVVNVMAEAGIVQKIARTLPMAVIKG